MIDLGDVAFVVGLGLMCYGAFNIAGGWAVAVVVGAVFMGLGVLRQVPRRG